MAVPPRGREGPAPGYQGRARSFSLPRARSFSLPGARSFSRAEPGSGYPGRWSSARSARPASEDEAVQADAGVWGRRPPDTGRVGAEGAKSQRPDPDGPAPTRTPEPGTRAPGPGPRKRRRPAPKDRPALCRTPPAAITPYRNARFTTQKAHAATIAAAGMVMNQPRTMFLATPHRTAFTRFVAPTPMIAEVMTWVVEIGALKR